MDPIAAILLSVQTQLGARVPELAYIDKDWGQLSYEVPSVKWPCALLDVENVNYTQEGGGRQMADTQLTITVADMRLTPASLAAPKRQDAYRIIELRWENPPGVAAFFGRKLCTAVSYQSEKGHGQQFV